MKSRVFIGSSTEGLKIAKAFQQELDYLAEVEIWSQGLFGLSLSSLESLCSKLNDFDFAILVLTPDDVIIKRETEIFTPRDNVIFELGLLIGLLGRNNVFITHERGINLNIPTDLSGITTATYSIHSTGNLQSSIGSAATSIINTIESNFVKKLNAKNEKLIESKIIISLNKKILENLIALLSPLRYAYWRYLCKEDKTGKANWRHGEELIVGANNFEVFKKCNFNFPNIFSTGYFKDKYDYRTPSIVFHEIFNFYWMRNYEPHGFHDEITVLDFFKSLMKGVDNNFNESISQYGNILPKNIISAILDLREDKEYKLWINLPDGLSCPGYHDENRVIPYIDKAIHLRDLLNIS